MNMDNTELLKTVQALQVRVETLEAESEIRKLHHKYGYYMDKCLYKEVHGLFANDPDTYVQFMNGRFRGKAGVKRLYIDRFSAQFVRGRNGPVHGFLLDHLMAQDVVDYFPDSSANAPGGSAAKAKARFRALMSAGNHMSMDDSQLPRPKRQWWEGGLYENEYIKEDGVWKIFRLRYFPFWHGEVHDGWQFTQPDYVPPFARTLADGDTLGPDELLMHDEKLWPDTRVLPFHYPHPVTREQIAEADLRAPPLGANVDDPGVRVARFIDDSF